MKKKRWNFRCGRIPCTKQVCRIMKLTTFLLFVFFFQVSAGVFSQNNGHLSLKAEKESVNNILKLIEEQTEFRFMYNANNINVERKVNINCDSKSITEVLDMLFEGTDIRYRSFNNSYVLFTDTEKTTESAQQQKSVSGKVTDSSGTSLPGVSVVVKGTTSGSITDANGDYSLSHVPDNFTLQFSFVGMKTQEVATNGKTTINVTLEEDAIGIEEVVAVGYGTQKKRDIIGSISVMKAASLEAPSGSSNFNSALQGQAAGVSVQSSSGRLGANVDIKIRGLSSISAGTSPLWIIDGVPIITDINVDNNGSAAQSPMALINQSDIESIQVLKDAAATSIYGSRGSNGVIMITTKSGTTGKASLNVDYSTGISNLPSQRPHFTNTTKWFEMMDEAKKAYGLGEFTMSDIYSKQPYATEFLTRAQAEKINTNWFKETMRKGSFQNVNFSTTGGDKAVRYFVSGNYRNDKSVMNNEDLERYGLRANIDLKPTNSLDLGAKINLSLSNGNRGKNNYGGGNADGNKTGTGGGFSYINYVAMPFEPVHSLANPLLYYNPYAGNPVATSDPSNMVENLEMYRVLASTYAEYALSFMKGLSVRTELSVDFIQSNRNFWVSDAIRYLGSLAQDNSSTARTINYNVFLKYDKSFGDHNFNAVGGTESQRSTTWYRNMEGQNLIGKYQQLGTPSLLTTMSSGLAGENYLKSYFGRANYKFKDKYLAGISVRRDGSSVFTPEYRWGNFIALSAGWILSDEAFMGEFGKKHFLKVRGSFGQTGNASIPGKLDVTGYQSNFGYGDGTILGNNGTLVTSIGVTNLKWESTNNSDLGIDFGFFDHRIDGSLAYYNKYVKDLLLASALPNSAGVASIWGNIGDLVNSGIELSITSTNLASGKLKWQTTLNIAYNHNEVKKLTPQVDAKGTGMAGAPYITKVGYGVREYYIADLLVSIHKRDWDRFMRLTKLLTQKQGKQND